MEFWIFLFLSESFRFPAKCALNRCHDKIVLKNDYSVIAELEKAVTLIAKECAVRPSGCTNGGMSHSLFVLFDPGMPRYK